jgi:hypothetical protein
MKNLKVFIIGPIAILILILFLQSCKTADSNSSNNISDYISISENTPMIIFFNCSFVYDSVQQEYKMSLISKDITKGRLKDSTMKSEDNEIMDFKYCLLNENSQVVSQKYMQHPLNQTMEYVDEFGRLQKKDIRLDSTNVLLRISLTSDIHYISFYMHEKQLLLINLRK